MKSLKGTMVQWVMQLSGDSGELNLFPVLLLFHLQSLNFPMPHLIPL